MRGLPRELFHDHLNTLRRSRHAASMRLSARWPSPGDNAGSPRDVSRKTLGPRRIFVKPRRTRAPTAQDSGTVPVRSGRLRPVRGPGRNRVRK